MSVKLLLDETAKAELFEAMRYIVQRQRAASMFVVLRAAGRISASHSRHGVGVPLLIVSPPNDLGIRTINPVYGFFGVASDIVELARHALADIDKEASSAAKSGVGDNC
jgi:hypothetical protein